MGGLVLSHFLTISTSSPRLASSLRRVGAGVQIRHSKVGTSIPHSPLRSSSAGFRCCCSFSLSQPPPASETSPTTEEDSVWSPANRFYSPWELSRCDTKLDYITEYI